MKWCMYVLSIVKLAINCFWLEHTICHICQPSSFLLEIKQKYFLSLPITFVTIWGVLGLYIMVEKRLLKQKCPLSSQIPKQTYICRLVCMIKFLYANDPSKGARVPLE